MAIDQGTAGVSYEAFPPDAAAEDLPTIRVVSVGDSTLTGEGLSEEGRTWLQLALDDLTTDKRQIVYVNGAKPGGRLAHAMHQLRAMRQENADILVIAVGTNDLTSLRRLAGLLRYRRRYRRLLVAASDRAQVVVVTGVGDLSLSPRFRHQPILLLFKPVTKFASWYANRQISEAVKAEQIAGRDILLIDPREVGHRMAAGRQWLFSPDHFHPNDRGHRVWAELAGPKLEDALDTVTVPPDRLVTDRTEPRLIPSRLGFARIRTAGPPEATRAVVLIPDAPNTLECYDELLAALQEAQQIDGSGLSEWPRIVALEMPGLGYSNANGRFDFSLRMGAEWIEGVLAHEGIDQVLIATSCINGLWAAKFAQVYPNRVGGLVLGQTPSLGDLQAWGTKTIGLRFRWPVIGPIALRLCRRSILRDWYKRTAPRSDQRRKLKRQALIGLRAGAQWQLGPLYRSIMRERVDPLEHVDDSIVTYLWGGADKTYDWLPPNREADDHIGHFPDLEDTATVVEELDLLAQRARAQEWSRGYQDGFPELAARRSRG